MGSTRFKAEQGGNGRIVGRIQSGPMEFQGRCICPRVTDGPGFLVGVGPSLHGKQEGAGVSVTFCRVAQAALCQLVAEASQGWASF